MGVYLDSKTGYTLYSNEMEKPYFVDKSLLLKELFPLIDEGSNYVCITRPRRFGKTVMTNMITAFFSRACDTKEIFQKLFISQTEEYEQYINHYAVISIPFNDVTGDCVSYGDYIGRIEKRLVKDLKKAYPEIVTDETEYLVDILQDIYEEKEEKFIFVLDEWDYIFHQDFASETYQEIISWHPCFHHLSRITERTTNQFFRGDFTGRYE